MWVLEYKLAVFIAQKMISNNIVLFGLFNCNAFEGY
jgi:hypothetical protein